MGKNTPKKDKTERERVVLESDDPNAERMDALRSLFPEAFAEGKVDFEKLKTALGEGVNDAPERYTFSWAGKSEAIRILQTPTRATLKPCKEESVDWDSTKNLFLEGDNLEVLKLLYKSYFGRVKMIYIDPPYNTGNDFVYPDNYADPLATYLELTGQQDAEGNLLTSNPETSGRYHSAWLSMMYPRLFLARQLLREDGVIFVSIDDTEVHNLRMMMNEIFGEENFIANVIWEKKYAKQNDSKGFSNSHDHILLFCRNISAWTPSELPRTDSQLSSYKNPDDDPRGPWQSVVYTCNKTKNERPNLYYPVTHPKTGEKIYPLESRVWYCDQTQHKKNVEENRIWWGLEDEKTKPRLKVYLSEVKGGIVPSTIWSRKEAGDTQESKRRIMDLFDGNPIFDTPKPPRLIEQMIQVSSPVDEDSIVLDFFSGSSSTADAVLCAQNKCSGRRQFILVQLPEPTSRDDYPTIADIGKERIRRVIAKIKAEREEAAKKAEERLFKDEAGKDADLDLGFRVYKLSESTHRPWQHTRRATPEQFAEYQTQLEEHLDPILEGSAPEDILWEVALKEGYSLSSRVEFLGDTAEIKPRKKGKPTPRATSMFNLLFRIVDEDKGQSLLICLDDEITLPHAKTLELKKNDLFVCRDRAITDEVAANLALQCRLKTI
jgi:adenine-specific DNA-methyltransferase